MMSLSLVFVVVAATLSGIVDSAGQNASCRDGWNFYKDGHTCIKAFQESKKMEDAKAICAREDGRLLQIPDAQTQAFVEKILNDTRGYWIGLTDAEKEGHFKWLDGEPLSGFEHWHKWEPNNAGEEDCVQLRGNRFWNDLPCKIPIPFICEAKNECAENNGGCDHICINTPQSRKCACHQGYTLVKRTQCVDETTDTWVSVRTSSPVNTPLWSQPNTSQSVSVMGLEGDFIFPSGTTFQTMGFEIQSTPQMDRPTSPNVTLEIQLPNTSMASHDTPGSASVMPIQERPASTPSRLQSILTRKSKKGSVNRPILRPEAECAETEENESEKLWKEFLRSEIQKNKLKIQLMEEQLRQLRDQTGT